MTKEIYNKYKKEAKKFYKKTENQDKDLWKHVKAVEKIAKCFCESMNLSNEEKLTIYLGCILHDIGKTDKVVNWYSKEENSSKNHNKIGAKYLKRKFLKKNLIDAYDKKIILSMVKYHRGKVKLKKHSKDALECFAISLVRFADKFANEKILIINGDVYKKL